MIVLDTNVVSEVFRPRPDGRVVAWLEGLTGEVAITAITLAELLIGVRRLPDGRRRSELRTRIDAALRPYRDTDAVLTFDDAAADRYADIVVTRERSGRPVSMADAQIAAICRSRDATLATRNTKDFVDTGVALIDPWAESR